MLARKLGWLAAEGCLMLLWARFGSPIALALAAALILIPLASIPLNLYLRKKLRLTLSAEPNLRKGRAGTVTLTLENPTILPVSLRCTLVVENLLTGEIRRKKVDLAPGRTAVTAGSRFCGRLRVRTERARLYDCFGLFGLRVNFDQKCHITVQPDCFEMALTIADPMSSTADAEVYSQHRPGHDLTETYQLREYVPGDSPRQIHWKLSGKLDRLIVRDPGLPITQDVLLFWERTGEAADPNLTDAQAEIVVSLSRALLDESIPFQIGWNDGAENRCILHEIRELDDLIAVLPRLLSAAACPQARHSGAALLTHTRPDVLCSHIVYLAVDPAPEALDWQESGHLTIITSIDAEKYPAQFGALTI